jgi:hypothetical protein
MQTKDTDRIQRRTLNAQRPTSNEEVREHVRARLRLGEPYGSERAARVGGITVRQLPDWRDPERFRGMTNLLGCKLR